MEDVNQLISVDPLYMEYARIAREKNVREPSSYAHSGKILVKIGRYSILTHIYIDCLMFALSDLPKTSWQLALFFIRNIHGIGRNRRGDPKIYMKYRPTDIIKRANIKGTRSFYQAINSLTERRMIFFKRNNVYCNIFPLTWKIENGFERLIKETVEKEIEKIKENGIE